MKTSIFSIIHSNQIISRIYIYIIYLYTHRRDVSQKMPMALGWFTLGLVVLGSLFPVGDTRGVSGDEESKGKGEAKQRHSTGSERGET